MKKIDRSVERWSLVNYVIDLSLQDLTLDLFSSVYDLFSQIVFSFFLIFFFEI